MGLQIRKRKGREEEKEKQKQVHSRGHSPRFFTVGKQKRETERRGEKEDE